eukprot:GHUV01045242.1.p1 GENE.GHUV01045242.1~~GHUV01045242.1.p1  ORF type:complete len:109 (+),score=14.53 GHUV01045242.1:237-563(+)
MNRETHDKLMTSCTSCHLVHKVLAGTSDSKTRYCQYSLAAAMAHRLLSTPADDAMFLTKEHSGMQRGSCMGYQPPCNTSEPHHRRKCIARSELYSRAVQITIVQLAAY